MFRVIRLSQEQIRICSASGVDTNMIRDDRPSLSGGVTA